MTDEAVDSEVSQAAIEISPIGANAVTEVLDVLDKDFTGQNWQEYINAKGPILATENPHVSEYLMLVGDLFPGEEGLEFKAGVILASEILKKRVGRQGLQKLSVKFVNEYDRRKTKRIDDLYGTERQKRGAGVMEDETIRRASFVTLERDAYRVLEQRIPMSDPPFFGSALFSGIVSSYFLLKDGLSYPSHWEQRKQGLN